MMLLQCAVHHARVLARAWWSRSVDAESLCNSSTAASTSLRSGGRCALRVFKVHAPHRSSLRATATQVPSSNRSGPPQPTRRSASTRAAELLVDLVRDRLARRRYSDVLFRQKCRRATRRLHERVDTARNAAGKHVNQLEARRLEMRGSSFQPTCFSRCSIYACVSRVIERSQVVGAITRCRNCCICRTLHHRRAAPAARPESSAAAPGRPAGNWTACATLPSRPVGQILGLVDDQQGAFLVNRKLAQEGLQRCQQHGLVDRFEPAARTRRRRRAACRRRRAGC